MVYGVIHLFEPQLWVV